jgi:hypothetical protein
MASSYPLLLPKSRRDWLVAFAVALLFVVWWHRPAQFDPDVPFLVEFGRGSGYFGLDTIKVFQDGTVTLCRKGLWYDFGEARLRWATAVLRLPPGSLAQVLDAVEKNRLLGLDREYHADILDGTQWVLRVKQGEKGRVVYFNNRFPEEIVRFAEDLDRILAENGLERVRWRRVAEADAWEYQRALWVSIRR